MQMSWHNYSASVVSMTTDEARELAEVLLTMAIRITEKKLST